MPKCMTNQKQKSGLSDGQYFGTLFSGIKALSLWSLVMSNAQRFWGVFAQNNCSSFTEHNSCELYSYFTTTFHCLLNLVWKLSGTKTQGSPNTGMNINLKCTSTRTVSPLWAHTQSLVFPRHSRLPYTLYSAKKENSKHTLQFSNQHYYSNNKQQIDRHLS